MFPSIISTFSQVSASDRLNSPSHSALHNSVGSVLTQVQTVIGTDASILGTIIGDLRNPNSTGGGHVQSATKGGTGQTTFTKGDLFVATSPSVISKLAVGTDGQQLISDSSVAAGVRWAPGSSNKISESGASSVAGNDTVVESSVFSVSIPGSTLGTSNAIRATLFVNGLDAGAVSSVLVQANYGRMPIASVKLLLGGNGFATSGYKGYIQTTLLSNSSSVLQTSNMIVNVTKDALSIDSPSVIGARATLFGTSSINSSASETFGMTVRFSTADSSNGLRFNGYVIEKIV